MMVGISCISTNTMRVPECCLPDTKRGMRPLIEDVSLPCGKSGTATFTILIPHFEAGFRHFVPILSGWIQIGFSLPGRFSVRRRRMDVAGKLLRTKISARARPGCRREW
jgi:hypothetical protein